MNPPMGLSSMYLVTSTGQPGLGDGDQLLRRALLDAGVPVTVAVWTDLRVDWAVLAAAGTRPTW